MPSILTRPSGGGGAGGSLSIAVSSATPDYNGSLTITATATGITPTSYTFQISDAESGTATVTQVSNVLAWTVNKVGTVTIGVTATDGSSEVGATEVVTVTDPLNYAAKLVDYDMRSNVTLVSELVDVIGDSSGNGHDVTAYTAANRMYYDSYTNTVATTSNGDLRGTSSNPLAGVADFSMFVKCHKHVPVSTNTRVICFGTSASGLGVGLLSFGSGNLTIGTNNFAQYQSTNVNTINGEPFSIVKNGTNPYDIYADGVITTPTGSSGTPPATIATGNGIYLGSQNGSFKLTGAIQRIVIFDEALNATQVAAINARIKQLHP